MDNLQRAKASRRGGRSFVTRLFTKALAITEADDEVTPDSISEADRETIDLVLKQLSTKKRQLEELDQTIAATIKDEKELEDEVEEAETYQFDLLERIAALQKFSSAKRANQPPGPSAQAQQEPTVENAENIEQPLPENNEQETEEENVPPPRADVTASDSVSHVSHVVHNVGQFVSWLPKLTLPTFSGDPLQFQTFWDSFQAAVHSNDGLTGVQKFHFLKAQLLGDAAHVIDNFPLTNVNYQHCVALLKDRFGQPYKLVNAHMDALANLPKPVNNISSLQGFHDKLESHMRALQSLLTLTPQC